MPGGVLYNGVVEAAAQGISQDIKTLTGAAADTSVTFLCRQCCVQQLLQLLACTGQFGYQTIVNNCWQSIYASSTAPFQMTKPKPASHPYTGALQRLGTRGKQHGPNCGTACVAREKYK